MRNCGSWMVPTGRRFAPPDDRLRTRPQMCNCTSGKLEIPGSLALLAPRIDERENSFKYILAFICRSFGRPGAATNSKLVGLRYFKPSLEGHTQCVMSRSLHLLHLRAPEAC